MWPHVPLVLKQLYQEYLPVVSMSDIRARHTVKSMFKNLPSTPTYISFPELKEAYILLAINTNKLSSKFTSIHITFLSYFSGDVGCSWSAFSYSWFHIISLLVHKWNRMTWELLMLLKAHLAVNTKECTTPGRTHTDFVDTFLVFRKEILLIW